MGRCLKVDELALGPALAAFQTSNQSASGLNGGAPVFLVGMKPFVSGSSLRQQVSSSRALIGAEVNRSAVPPLAAALARRFACLDTADETVPSSRTAGSCGGGPTGVLGGLAFSGAGQCFSALAV